jgi:error-prone DNA polymerase
MRLGFNYVHGIGVGALETLKRERERGEFKDLQDFCDRVCVREAEQSHSFAQRRPVGLSPRSPWADEATSSVQERRGHPGTSLNPAEPAPLTRVAVENLVLIGAFDFLGKPRRQLLWEVKEAFAEAGKTRLVRPVVESLPLPEMTELERTSTDYRVMALTIGRHLVSYYRDQLDELQVTDSRALKDVPDGGRIKVAGLVITRQAPGTAKRFRFFTLEDEWGHINIILRPDFFARHRKVANQNQMLFFEGAVQHQDGVISVLAEDVRALSLLPDTAPRSRDFR